MTPFGSASPFTVGQVLSWAALSNFIHTTMLKGTYQWLHLTREEAGAGRGMAGTEPVSF